MIDLKAVKDCRANEFFQQLNRRYFEFAKRLPSPLAILAQRKNTYSGNQVEEPFEHIASLNPVLVTTPWLFWEVFQGLDDHTFLGISEAGMYFVLASVVLDHMVDRQASQPQTINLLHQALYQRGLTAYHEVLPVSSLYWAHFERLAALHLKGLSTELEIQEHRQQVDLETLFTMAHGKVAPIVTTSAALAYASGQPEVLAPIENSLNHISVASQLLDDIGDWQDDLQAHHMTYYLGQCAPSGTWLSHRWPTIEEVQARLEAEWLDTTHMHLVVDRLEEAVNAVQNLNCPGWVEYVNRYQQRADQHLTDFYTIHIGQVFKPRPASSS